MKTTQMIEPRLAVRFVIPALACVAALILGRFLVASENPWTALLFVVEIVLAATAVVNPRLGIYLFVAAAGYSDLLKRLGIVFGPVQGEDIVVALASAPLLFGATAVGTLFYQVIFARSKLTKAQWIMLCICAAIAVINALKARNAGGFAASAQLFIGSSLYYLLVPTAPLRVLHNVQAAREVRNLHLTHHFDAWEIHNVFPALSASIYEEAIRLGVPIIHYLHNYRLSCVNGMFLNHGKLCHRCIGGNFFPAFETCCWRSSRIACGIGGAALHRVRRSGIFEKAAAWIALSEAQKQWSVRIGNRVTGST
jgi:hypothetical protein